MKIGIITFHCATNYGAVLQALGLCNVLKEMGHEVKIIDYRPRYLTNCYNPWKVYRKKKKRMIRQIYLIPFKIIINKKFDRFIKKYMKMTDKTYFTNQEIHNMPPKFDIYITGSDQVWNPELTGGEVDDVFYLGFAPKEAKRVSYAASIGSTEIDKHFWSEIASNIRKIDYVSIRELDGQSFIKKITGIEAVHVLDPVLLLDKSKWNEFAEKSVPDDNHYLLIYALSPNKLLDEVALKVAKVMNLRVVNIGLPVSGDNNYDQQIHSGGPGKFLELFKNAAVVCTNSFHGTAFSIIYEKPFLVTPSFSGNERIDSLLKTLGLSSKKISSISQLEGVSIDNFLKYDVNKVSNLLEAERRKSLEFLKNALRN